MKITYTSKKFFKKYIYRLIFEVTASRPISRYFGDPSELRTVPQWIEQNHNNIDCKIVNRFQSSNGNDVKFHQMIYLQDESVLKQMQLQFAGNLLEVSQPLDANHAAELEIRNLLCVRKELLFKKYKMAIYFKYDRRGEVYKWLKNYFAHSSSSKLSGNHWWPRLYLNDDSEIAMIKLSWPESIDYIKRVVLINNK